MSDFKYTPQQLRWIKALESGDYKQTSSVLDRGDSACCLGVACKLFAAELNVPATPVKCWSEDGKLTTRVVAYDGKEAALPAAIVKHLGLLSNLGDCQGGGHSLSGMNDTGRTFKQIAKVLRDNPSHYFVLPKSPDGGSK